MKNKSDTGLKARENRSSRKKILWSLKENQQIQRVRIELLKFSLLRIRGRINSCLLFSILGLPVVTQYQVLITLDEETRKQFIENTLTVVLQSKNKGARMKNTWGYSVL